MTEENNPQNEQSKDIPNPQNEQSKDIPIPEKDENKITIKKSSYDNILKALVVTIAVAAFFGGYGLASMDNSNSVSNEEITKLLNQLEQRPVPTQQPAAPAETPLIMVSLDDDPVKGSPDAPVTIIEFSDFQCPFCSRFYTQTLPLIEKDYIDTGKVKLVYRDLPLENIHQNAIPAHIAAECADEQGKFWEYHDILFDNQLKWQGLGPDDIDSTLSAYADQLGLQTSSFDSCMKSPDMAEEVNDDLLDARRAGASGTPTFFIGNEKDGFVKIAGAQAYSSFKRVIDEQLS